MTARSIVVAVLLLIATYVPAFTLISLLATQNPDFASAVESDPWAAVPIVIGLTLCTAMLLIAIVGRGRFALYGFKLPRGLDILKALAVGFLVGVLLYVVATLGSVELTWMGPPSSMLMILLSWTGPPIQEEVIFQLRGFEV